MLDEKNPQKSRCIRCDTCDGFPCLVYAKADAQVICVDPALEHPNVTLLTEAYVERLETSTSGREVTKVHVMHNGEKETYSADMVVSSCGAINSAALLLRSANERYPQGLANSSGVVGRHYMCHLNSMLLAVSLNPNPTNFQKTWGLNDFYFPSKEWDYPMGHISMIGKTDASILRAGAPRIVPGMTLEVMANHSLSFWLTSEDLPDPNNQVMVNREGTTMLSYTLGIDHTALVVNNTEASLKFYRDLLGLKIVGTSENYGTEQEHLNNVFGARLRITSLRAGSGPGIEFLEYLAPCDGRPIPTDEGANDLTHWQTRLITGNVAVAAQQARAGAFAFVSPGVVTLPEATLGFTKGFLLRDPDGHVMQLTEP